MHRILPVKILHLTSDEKFINFSARQFNSCDQAINRFVVVANTSTPLIHIGDLGDFQVVDKRYFGSKRMLEDLAWCDCLVVHFLTELGARMIAKAPERIAVVWSGWGADYYHLLDGGERSLFGEETRRLRTQRKRWFGLVKRGAKRVIFGNRINQVISRVNYFSSPIPEDFEILTSALKEKLSAEYVQLNYGSVEETYGIGQQDLTGNDILVGNSATWTNNHLDVFKQLASLELGMRRLVVPLNYGDTQYRDMIVSIGSKIFGEHFLPLVEFMPLEKYNTLIANCSVVVMGHRRQQAGGNICTMLYKGAKVFLDQQNPFYAFFVKHGAHVFSLEDLAGSGFAPLTDSQKQTNRDVLEQFWGQRVVRDNICKLVERVNERKLINA